MKNALIFDPYLDTLGGGERYTLTVASHLSSLGFNTVLAWDQPDTVKAAAERFHLDLDCLELSAEYFRLFTNKADLLTRRRALSLFDVVFVVSDGSVPVLFGKNNLLHYQVPFTHINQPRLINRLKLLSINHIVVNSAFTKKVIDRTLGSSKSVVLYPPVPVADFAYSGEKQNLILNVGRFTSPSHSKRQDVLIQAFKQLVDDGLTGWKLVLAGGKTEHNTLLDEFQESSRGYPIEFKANIPFAELKSLYQQAVVYWHAAGYEVDEALNPEAVEHFGITTVEAMAAGCVPVVIGKGGQPEIVTPGTGYCVDDIPGFINRTKALINHPSHSLELSRQAARRAQEFSADKFCRRLEDLINA